MQTCTLAVDIGASSGRHIAGTVQNGKITLQEVYRFENGVHRENGHLCWDIDTLAKEVVNGLKAAHDAGFAPATIGIDTWAVDFVLLDADNKRIGDAVAYRDERTEGIREALEKEYGRALRPHRHPVPAVQHGLPADGAQKGAPGAAGRRQNIPDGSRLPELPALRRARQ